MDTPSGAIPAAAPRVCEGLRAIWPLPDDSLLLNSGKDWILQLLSKCSHPSMDLVIMTIWRIWQLRNDITHGKNETPVEITMDYLDSYYKSLNLVRNYSMEEIIKGKMPRNNSMTDTLFTTDRGMPLRNLIGCDCGFR
ncbi:Alpha-amylase [Hordeum vulgare]|nr:Alpha-amylase [Hordeum vulgare]